MGVDIYSLTLIALIAFVLILIDRVYRINPYLAYEGFQVHGEPQRCGVDLSPCVFPKRCMNGFCYREEEPQLHDRNPLPVIP